MSASGVEDDRQVVAFRQTQLRLQERNLALELRIFAIEIEANFPTFLKPNSAEYIRWSASEISTDGLEMTVALRETSVGKGVPGKFRALATFNFSYQ